MARCCPRRRTDASRERRACARVGRQVRESEVICNSRVPMARRGGKLLERLKGDAFQKAELLDPMELQNDNGVEILLKYLRDKYEPLEAIKIG
eukprot:1314263-Amphidinium_carterae.2